MVLFGSEWKNIFKHWAEENRRQKVHCNWVSVIADLRSVSADSQNFSSFLPVHSSQRIESCSFLKLVASFSRSLTASESHVIDTSALHRQYTLDDAHLAKNSGWCLLCGLCKSFRWFHTRVVQVMLSWRRVTRSLPHLRSVRFEFPWCVTACNFCVHLLLFPALSSYPSFTQVTGQSHLSVPVINRRQEIDESEMKRGKNLLLFVDSCCEAQVRATKSAKVSNYWLTTGDYLCRISCWVAPDNVPYSCARVSCSPVQDTRVEVGWIERGCDRQVLKSRSCIHYLHKHTFCLRWRFIICDVCKWLIALNQYLTTFLQFHVLSCLGKPSGQSCQETVMFCRVVHVCLSGRRQCKCKIRLAGYGKTFFDSLQNQKHFAMSRYFAGTGSYRCCLEVSSVILCTYFSDMCMFSDKCLQKVVGANTHSSFKHLYLVDADLKNNFTCRLVLSCCLVPLNPRWCFWLNCSLLAAFFCLQHCWKAKEWGIFFLWSKTSHGLWDLETEKSMVLVECCRNMSVPVQKVVRFIDLPVGQERQSLNVFQGVSH